MYSWQVNSYEIFYSVVTEHPCPACGQKLRLFPPSNMLTCENEDTDPLFLV